MSRENVNVVLRTFRAFREHDEALFANYASDVEWELGRYSPWTDQQLFRGHDGVREFFRQWLADFDGYTTEACDPVDAGDRVVQAIRVAALREPPREFDRDQRKKDRCR